MDAQRKTKYGVNYDITSKYQKNLQRTEKFLNTLIKKKEEQIKGTYMIINVNKYIDRRGRVYGYNRGKMWMDEKSRRKMWMDQQIMNNKSNKMMNRVVDYKEQKKMFGKDWIRLNKFDVLQKSSHNNQFRNDLVKQQ